jgi:hypothetical protein
LKEKYVRRTDFISRNHRFIQIIGTFLQHSLGILQSYGYKHLSRRVKQANAALWRNCRVRNSSLIFFLSVDAHEDAPVKEMEWHGGGAYGQTIDVWNRF